LSAKGREGENVNQRCVRGGEGESHNGKEGKRKTIK